jgi:hypothetical protein
MKVYFTGSSSEATSQDIENYSQILNFIKQCGHITTNPYFEERLLNKSKAIVSAKDDVYDILREKITESDCVIAEISVPSISLGIQIEYALSHKVPVLCLLHDGGEDKLPLMIRDYKNNLLTKSSYENKSILPILKKFFLNFPKSRVKFNMFISHELDKYLSHLSEKESIPKSEVLRKLLTERMVSDESFDPKK